MQRKGWKKGRQAGVKNVRREGKLGGGQRAGARQEREAWRGRGAGGRRGRSLLAGTNGWGRPNLNEAGG